MNAEEMQYWLRWNRVPGIGSIRFFKLLQEFGNMKDAWHAPLSRLQPLIGEKAAASLRQTRAWDPERELRSLGQQGFWVVCHPDENYPAPLRKIADPPPLLYGVGQFSQGDDIAIAVVGTRNPSPQGEYIAQELAMNLSHQGLTIVSGMARGIDSQAHLGALEAQGRTIAVLGCGLDIVYPPENRDLMERIVAQGAVVSEYPLKTQPLAQNFPARNRIISGLSLGVVVVEAAQDSGSLITAGFAVEQGREVFAVPGNIGSDGSKGPHKLLKQGAKLVEDYRDILAELAIPHLEMAEVAAAQIDSFSPSEQKILGVMSREPLHVDQILRRVALAPAELNAVLIQLELKGVVKRFPGQLYLRLK